MRAVAVSILCLLLAIPGARAADDRLEIDVRGSSGKSYQLAVQRFEGGEGVDLPLVKSFRADLVDAIEFSGLVRGLPEQAYLGPSTTDGFAMARIDCPSWQASGADGLIEGRLEREESRVRVQFRVWDTIRCQEMGDASRFESASDAVDYLARRLADEVVLRFTGTRGVATTQIAFVSDAAGNKEVHIMRADGTDPVRVTGNGAINLFPSWSPDGDALLYTSYRGGSPDVWIIGRSRRYRSGRVGDPATKLRGVWGPRDASRPVALVISDRGNSDLWLARADGSRMRQITHDRALDVSPSWSPDGRRIAFVSDRGGSPQVYIYDVSSEETRRLTFRGSYNTSPAWSPRGDWIAYAAQTGTNSDIYLIDPETGYTTPIVVHPRSDEEPTWSPDGRKIAFVSTRRGRSEIYSIGVDGSNLRRLTAGLNNSSNPAWSSWLD